MRWPLRRAVLPLPPMRSTAEILTEIDHQVGRLSVIRDQAITVISRLEARRADDAVED